MDRSIIFRFVIAGVCIPSLGCGNGKSVALGSGGVGGQAERDAAVDLGAGDLAQSLDGAQATTFDISPPMDIAPEGADATQDMPTDVGGFDTPSESTPAVDDAGTSDDAVACSTRFPTGDIGCILDDNLAPLATAVAAATTVLSVDDVDADGCAGLTNPSGTPGASSGGGPAKRIVLSADTRRWTLYARVPGLPADLLRGGDQVDLTVNAYNVAVLVPAVNQTVVVARNNRLIMFVSSLRSGVGGQVPALDPYGIAVNDDGVTCESTAGITCCSFREHRTLVTAAGHSTTILPGQTAVLGNLSFTVEAFLTAGSNQCCDGFHPTQMAGFIRP